jgi:hypothetical protein
MQSSDFGLKYLPTPRECEKSTTPPSAAQSKDRLLPACGTPTPRHFRWWLKPRASSSATSFFSPVTIDAWPEEGMALATLAVVPHRQHHGIGSALVQAGLRILQERACPFVIVIGHPGFYPPFVEAR